MEVKKCPKPSWQALTPPGERGNKSAPNHPGKPLHPPTLLTGNTHMKTTHFKKGLPLLSQSVTYVEKKKKMKEE